MAVGSTVVGNTNCNSKSLHRGFGWVCVLCAMPNNDGIKSFLVRLSVTVNNFYSLSFVF